MAHLGTLPLKGLTTKQLEKFASCPTRIEIHVNTFASFGASPQALLKGSR
jgi:hypothetical protein